MAQSRTHGYVRASIDPEVPTVEVQKAIIADYCHNLGRSIDGMYVDRAAAGTRHFLDREAGRHLLRAAERGDHIVVARADRLSRSFPLFARALVIWYRTGVTVHLCDMPGAVLDANNAVVGWIVGVMSLFADYERRMVQLRSKESARQLDLQRRRKSRFAPFGFEWQRREGKTYIVEKPAEQAIVAKVIDMASEGYSIDHIRQHLTYELGIRNRKGKPFGLTELRKIAASDAQRLHEARSALG